MTTPRDPAPHDGFVPPGADLLIDGYTLDQLSRYLDAGMTPSDPAIDSSPACRLALDSLRAVDAATVAMLDREAAAEPPTDPEWINRIVGAISLNVRPGRIIPLPYPDPAVTLTVTESAIRGLIRSAGDRTRGVLIGRCTLDGDVTVVGAPIRIGVDAAMYWGRNLPATAAQLRLAISDALHEQTDLIITDIDVNVHDIHVPSARQLDQDAR